MSSSVLVANGTGGLVVAGEQKTALMNDTKMKKRDKVSKKNKKNKKSAKSLLLQYLVFKSLGPSKYHFALLRDDRRWATYAQALERCVASIAESELSSGCVNILDVGAGWGIMSIIARRAVRRKLECDANILKIERLKPIARACLDLIEAAAEDDDEPESSTETVVASLDEEQDRDNFTVADMVLLDTFAPGLFEPSNTGDLTSGLLSTLRSLRDSGVVTPRTKFVPRGARVFASLVHIPPQPCVPSLSFPLDQVRGVHVSPFNAFRHSPNGFDAVAVEAIDRLQYLTDTFVVDADVDFGKLVRGANACSADNCYTAGLSTSVRTVCTKSGNCNGMVLWYELMCGVEEEVAPEDLTRNRSFNISSSPSPTSTRRQAVVLLDTIDVVSIQEGDKLSVFLDRGGVEDVQGHVRYFSLRLGDDSMTDKMNNDFQLKKSEPLSKPSTVSRWHFSMLLDDDRNSKYQQAIEKEVKKLPADALVLDIGTGTGLLASFAARAGASRVVGCEANAPIARVGNQCIKRNRLEDKVRIVRAHSTDLVIGSDEETCHMAEKASLLVSEILDCGLLGEAVLPVLKHARQHLLKEGGVVIPARARVKGVLVELTSGAGNAVVTRPPTCVGPPDPINGEGSIKAGLAFNKFIRTNTWEQIRLRDLSHEPLSEPFEMMTCDLSGFSGSSAGGSRGNASDREDETSCDVDVPIIMDGKICAVVMWFDLDVDPDGEFVISTGPQNRMSCWSQSIQLLTDPEWPGDLDSKKEVRRGNTVRMRISQDDSRIRADLL